MTPISSKSDIWAESYDQNTGGRPDSFTEHPDGQLQPPFQNSTILPIISPRPDSLAKLSDNLLYLLSALVKETQNILKCWTSSGRVATSSRRLAETSQTVPTTEIQLRVELGEAWPSFKTMLLWRPDVFNTEGSRHCGASGRLPRPVQTVAQEPVVLTWKLHGIFMDIFLETCDHTHGMKWDTVHVTWRL
jgi:hypothetical protein